MKVLGISGSLRKDSYNTWALRAAQQLVPQGMTIEIADISQIPLYNGDVHAAGLPDAVAALKEQVRLADGVLLVTPEYNFSIPGVLKNTLDWLSRPPSPPFDAFPRMRTRCDAKSNRAVPAGGRASGTLLSCVELGSPSRWS